MGSFFSKHTKRPVTHLMIWVGSVLPESRNVSWRDTIQYQVNNTEDNTSARGKYSFVNYVKTLQGECKKMKDKNEACILVYDSKMITNEEKTNFKKIVEDIPNCYLVDYEDFVAKIDKNQIYDKPEKVKVFAINKSQDKDITPTKNTQGSFIQDINESIQSNIETQSFSVILSRRTIGNLVDCMRMLLLLHPSKLKSLAIDSNKEKGDLLLDPSDFSLLYHDFDMIQKTDEINTSYGDLIDDKKTSLMFWRQFDYGGLENGLILVNSLNDRNADIENIILHYINNNISMYSCSLKLFAENKKKLKNFRPWFDDEHHCSWKFSCKKNQPLTTPTTNINTNLTTNIKIINKDCQNLDNDNTIICQHTQYQEQVEVKKDEINKKKENKEKMKNTNKTNGPENIQRKNNKTNRQAKTTNNTNKSKVLPFKKRCEKNTNIVRKYLHARRHLRDFEPETYRKQELNRLGYYRNRGVYNPN